MKKTKGFTLVELIVVIAIIGVLAAILVPAMMGWITKANLRTANSGAKQIFTNAQTLCQDAEEREDPFTENAGLTAGSIVTINSGTTTVSAWSGARSVQAEMARRVADAKNAGWEALIFIGADDDNYDPGTVVGTAYTKVADSEKYIGTYPEDPENSKNHYADIGAAADAASEVLFAQN